MKRIIFLLIILVSNLVNAGDKITAEDEKWYNEEQFTKANEPQKGVNAYNFLTVTNKTDRPFYAAIYGVKGKSTDSLDLTKPNARENLKQTTRLTDIATIPAGKTWRIQRPAPKSGFDRDLYFTDHSVGLPESGLEKCSLPFVNVGSAAFGIKDFTITRDYILKQQIVCALRVPRDFKINL